jgi:hypothetical protein
VGFLAGSGCIAEQLSLLGCIDGVGWDVLDWDGVGVGVGVGLVWLSLI